MLHIRASPAASCGASASVTLVVNLEYNSRLLVHFPSGIQNKTLTTSVQHNLYLPRQCFQ